MINLTIIKLNYSHHFIQIIFHYVKCRQIFYIIGCAQLLEFVLTNVRLKTSLFGRELFLKTDDKLRPDPVQIK